MPMNMVLMIAAPFRSWGGITAGFLRPRDRAVSFQHRAEQRTVSSIFLVCPSCVAKNTFHSPAFPFVNFVVFAVNPFLSPGLGWRLKPPVQNSTPSPLLAAATNQGPEALAFT